MTYELKPLQHVNLECPFCKKEAVKAVYHPPILQAKTSRISAGAKTTFYQTREKYEIISGCSSCGKCCKRTKWTTNIDSRLVWEDIERWRKEGRDDILKYVYVFDGLGGDFFDKKTFKRFSKCPFLKKEGKIYSCSIHETKPRVCELFPFYFNYQGICENCGSSVEEEGVFCEECGLFLKVHPASNSCPGMRKTLKLLGLYREVYPPILELIGLGFRRG